MGNLISREGEESSEQLNDASKQFKKSIKEELTRTSKVIDEKFDAFMENKDRDIQILKQKSTELEKEKNSNYEEIKKQYKDKLTKLQRQHDHTIQELQKQHDHTIQELQKQHKHEIKGMLLRQNAENKQYQEEIQRLRKLTDQTREMRMRSDCKRVGDIEHSDVAKEFSQVYKERQLLSKLNITTHLERAKFLTELFEYAYKCCSKEIMSKAIEELETLHTAPKRPFTKEEMENPDIRFPWKGRQDAYSCLMSVANANHKLQSLPECVVNQVMEAEFIQCYVTTQEADVKCVVKRITELSWKMVLLSPPITFDNLPTYSEETHEISGEKDELLPLEQCEFEHMRPVLFYSPLGTIGQKGEARIVCKSKMNEQNKDNLQCHSHIETTSSKLVKEPDIKFPSQTKTAKTDANNLPDKSTGASSKKMHTKNVKVKESKIN